MEGIVHIPAYLTAEQATDYFHMLEENLPWQTVKWGATGRNLPRLVCSYERNTCISLEHLIELIEKAFNVDVAGVWCNFYRDGNDYTPPHKDNYDADVYTLSLGGTRNCVFTKDSDATRSVYTLASGDILFFDQATNAQYKHSIPKSANADPRISVVFFTHPKA